MGFFLEEGVVVFLFLLEGIVEVELSSKQGGISQDPP